MRGMYYATECRLRKRIFDFGDVDTGRRTGVGSAVLCVGAPARYTAGEAGLCRYNPINKTGAIQAI